MRHAKRDSLTTVDINNALKLRNVEVRREKSDYKETHHRFLRCSP